MLTLYALDEFLGGRETEWAGFRPWEGTPWPDDRARPATIVLKHPGALRAMFLQGSEVALAEAYLSLILTSKGMWRLYSTRARRWRRKRPDGYGK